MRILALCADPGIRLDAIKGATVHLAALWRSLARAGAQVTGVAPRASEPCPAIDGVDLRAVPASPAADLPERVRDVALGAAAEGAPPDLVLERLALGSAAGLELAERLRAPLVVEVNAPLDEEAARFRGRALTAEVAARQQQLLSGADLVYVVSEPLAEWAVRRGARPERVRVLPNGVDAAAFAGPREPALADAPVRAGFVGTFKAWHGLELVLDAFARARAHHAALVLELLGDGPLRPALEDEVAARGLGGRVRFSPPRPHAQVAAFLRRIDIGLVAAADATQYYFSPLKVYEYAAAGCAILAPRAGQIADRFRHDHDAWLVAPGDPVALADGLVRLAEDPFLRSRLGEAARERARNEFDWSVVAGTLLDWAQELRPAARSRP